MPFHPPTPLLSHLLYLSGPHPPTSTHSIIHQMPSCDFLLQSLPNLVSTQWSELTTPSSRPPLFCELGSNSSPIILYFCPHAYCLCKIELPGVQAILFMSIMPILDRASPIKSEGHIFCGMRKNERLCTSPSPREQITNSAKIKIWLTEGSSLLSFG